jgi:membrane fusion protein
MTISLFRQEVLAARSNQTTGSIILMQPVPMQIAAWVSIVITLALITYVSFGDYIRKVRVTGRIIPAAGALTVVSPQFGRVVARHVHDGDTVQAGQVLYELSSERISDKGDIDAHIDAALSTRRDLLVQERALQSQQLQQHEKSLRNREQLLRAEVARLDQEIALQQNRIANSEKMLTRYRALREQGFVSEFQLSQQENDHNDQLAKRQTLERAKLAAMRDSMQTQEEADQIAGQVKLATAQNARTLASLEQESAEHQGRSRIQIIASASGVVTALAVEPGQAVSTGTPLATILPTGSELEAELLAPSRAMGFVEQGQIVMLRLSAFPYQKFGQIEGKVVRVEQSPIAESNTTGQADAEPVYRIGVKLSQQSVSAYGKDQPFRTGMTLEADIRQDRRRLIEWVIDPLISVAKGRAG